MLVSLIRPSKPYGAMHALEGPIGPCTSKPYVPHKALWWGKPHKALEALWGLACLTGPHMALHQQAFLASQGPVLVSLIRPQKPYGSLHALQGPIGPCTSKLCWPHKALSW